MPRKDSEPDPMTADRLRKDIDRGLTGDKTDYPDPAAAPLGTDAEAGGNPPTAEQMRIARDAETRRPSERDTPSRSVDHSRGRPNLAEGEDD
jgi:hypothetical protein